MRKVTEKRMVVKIFSRRDASWSAAPCSGWLALYEDVDGSLKRPHVPWDDSWEPGTIVEVEMIARVVKFGTKSRKKCHVPWPAHVHDADKARRAKRTDRKTRR